VGVPIGSIINTSQQISDDAQQMLGPNETYPIGMIVRKNYNIRVRGEADVYGELEITRKYY
jgi:hypothetical protein